MFRKSPIVVALCFFYISLSAHAQYIDDLLSMHDMIVSGCGPRVDVLWVDETAQTPPCLMSYSSYCVEAQLNTPQSCEYVMKPAVEEGFQTTSY